MAREKKCPQCAEMVKAEALVCRFCGHQFPVSSTQSSGPNIGLWIGLVIVIAIIITVVNAATNGSSTAPSSSSAPDAVTNVGAPASATPQPPRSAWSYTKTTDELRGIKKVFARLTSDNTVDFDFPYNGGSSLTIIVRKDARGNNVMFSISKGQFVCGIESCRGEINVDGKRHALSLVSSGDGSSDTLFASNDNGTIRELVGAKKIIVELPFYQSGNQQFTFTTPIGLHWPPAASDF